MARLQVRLHRLPVEGCPLPSDPPLVDRQLAAARRDIERFQLPGLEAPYRWLDDNRRVVRSEEVSVLHNDFHPLNIMIEGDRMFVLDWTDAAVGDRHHDLARTLALFHLAPPLARNPLERVLLRSLRRFIIPRYLARYEEELPVDPARIRYWQALHAFKAWVQLLALSVDAEALGARRGAVEGLPRGLVGAVQSYFYERTSRA
jgi:aminoglycoside phosphotransferase (APT) family kinase protein